MRADQDEYIFEPASTTGADPTPSVVAKAGEPVSGARPMHPSVKLLNSRTTAVAAKFRSMVPENIKIWYENNQGGSFQGSLSLGKEYTLNTYEGHVFFFTNEAKTKEFARFTMSKDQVSYIRHGSGYAFVQTSANPIFRVLSMYYTT